MDTHAHTGGNLCRGKRRWIMTGTVMPQILNLDVLNLDVLYLSSRLDIGSGLI